MRDLRLVTSDENGITLETLDGEKFKLHVDDAVKAAVRTSGAKSQTAAQLTPRDIQDQVRSGLSIDEIVAQSGAEAHFVETFALPVLDELEHMVASARSVRLTIPGDRFSDDSQIEFGELVDRRLTDNGATEIAWASKRGESAMWLVSVSFELGGNFGVASWLFDPRKVELTAEDDTASALSVLDGNPGPLPKSRFATEPPAAFRKPLQAEKPTPAPTSKPKVAPVIDINAARDAQSEALVEQAAVEPEPQKEASVAETSTAEPAVMNVTTLQFKAEPVETTSEPEEPLLGAQTESETTETVDYLEVVEIVEVVEVDLAQDATTSIDIVDEPAQEDVPAVDISAESSAAEASESNEPPSATGSIGLPKKGRASMPSWDEIVFGTKTED